MDCHNSQEYFKLNAYQFNQLRGENLGNRDLEHMWSVQFVKLEKQN